MDKLYRFKTHSIDFEQFTISLRVRDFYKVCSLSSRKCLAENYAAENYLGNVYSVGIFGSGWWALGEGGEVVKRSPLWDCYCNQK